MKNLVNAVAILKVKKHPRTIDAFIKWIERCLFHDEFNAPTEQDLHIWLKHAKKFKREQDNLKNHNTSLRECILAMENDQACLPEDVSVADFVAILKRQIYGLQNILERYPPEYMIEEDNIFTVYCQACEGSWRNGADSKHDEDCEWEQALESRGDERCNYCKRTRAEAEGGYKCSTCKQGGDDETKNDIPPKERREDVEHPDPSP